MINLRLLLFQAALFSVINSGTTKTIRNLRNVGSLAFSFKLATENAILKKISGFARELVEFNKKNYSPVIEEEITPTLAYSYYLKNFAGFYSLEHFDFYKTKLDNILPEQFKTTGISPLSWESLLLFILSDDEFDQDEFLMQSEINEIVMRFLRNSHETIASAEAIYNLFLYQISAKSFNSKGFSFLVEKLKSIFSDIREEPCSWASLLEYAFSESHNQAIFNNFNNQLSAEVIKGDKLKTHALICYDILSKTQNLKHKLSKQATPYKKNICLYNFYLQNFQSLYFSEKHFNLFKHKVSVFDPDIIDSLTWSGLSKYIHTDLLDTLFKDNEDKRSFLLMIAAALDIKERTRREVLNQETEGVKREIANVFMHLSNKSNEIQLRNVIDFLVKNQQYEP